MIKPTIHQIKNNIYLSANIKVFSTENQWWKIIYVAKLNLIARIDIREIRLFINSQIKEEINEMRKKDLKFANTAAQIIVGFSLAIAAFILIETLLRRIFQ